MITNADLSSQTRRELAELAKNYGIAGWHSMRKDDLVSEITKIQRRLRRQVAAAKKDAASDATPATKSKRGGDVISRRSTSGSTTKRATPASASKADSSKKLKKPTVTTSALSGAASSSGSSSKSTGRTKTRKTSSRNDVPLPELSEPKVSAKTLRIRAEMRRRRELIQKRKDLSTSTLVAGSAVTDGAERHRTNTPHRDRIVLLVRDSFWLQASWEITQSSVQRAQSALAERWHTAVPTVRLLSVGDVSSNRAETVSRDIAVHGGVSTWYIDVQDPPSRYRVAIGYLADNGEFHCLCRSNVVETPVPGDCERLDEHWQDIAEDYERIYALSGGLESGSGELRDAFEDRLQRRMPHPADSGSMTGDPSLLRQSKLRLDVEAELIVFGKTDPTASVMVSGHPVKLQKDGAFTVRLDFPDKRQVLPITAETRDGLRQRTTVLAVERNTKVMDTVELQENN
ncbi:hypothetical protein FHS27_005392 [Rhodopirellula rubra]|uniref:Rho termination factor-like N-terminal domain-containing protein n=1 Tax=Aporhodopirellula rubra TaxID=980271 RepID=A0A7W5E588_9BACT|nr:DUF4912 domain-containing protein [Aporhodopirellula rubra]MBB3209552.1 hypothetical protein [Aporhodopirellula rubra]